MFKHLPSWDHSLIAYEVKKAFKLPEYDAAVDFYENFCVVQKQNFVVAKSWTAEELHQLPYVSSKLKQVGIFDQIGHGQIFVCRPRYVGLWHLDGVDRHASLNFPLFNTDEGVVEWTDEDIPCVMEANQYTTHSVPVDRFAPRNIIASSKLPCAQLLKTDIWHRLNNLG